jgi:hypothetical protein
VGRQSQIPAERHNNTDSNRGVFSRQGTGDILSKTKQANTHDAVLILYPGQK